MKIKEKKPLPLGAMFGLDEGSWMETWHPLKDKPEISYEP